MLFRILQSEVGKDIAASLFNFDCSSHVLSLLCAAPARLPQSIEPLDRLALRLLAPVALLGGGSALAMRCVSRLLRRRLRGGRLPLGSVFCFDSCGGVLLVSGVAHGRSGVCFVGALRVLPFLLFFLWRFLDAGELAQDFFSL